MKQRHSIWKLFIHYLHQSYLDCYVFNKDIHFRSNQYRSYLRDIHQTYYVDCKKKNNSPQVHKQDITDFLMKKHPQYIFNMIKNI